LSLQEMGKKICKSLKKRYCDIVSRFINFQLPDDPIHSLKETIQLFAMTGIRNSYVTIISRDMKAAGHSCQTGETAMDHVGPLLSSALFEEGCKANNQIIKNSAG